MPLVTDPAVLVKNLSLPREQRNSATSRYRPQELQRLKNRLFFSSLARPPPLNSSRITLLENVSPLNSRFRSDSDK
jgi:hypothetical protein